MAGDKLMRFLRGTTIASREWRLIA